MKSFAIYKFHGKSRKKRSGPKPSSPSFSPFLSPPSSPAPPPSVGSVEKFDYFSDFVKRHDSRARRIERNNPKKG